MNEVDAMRSFLAGKVDELDAMRSLLAGKVDKVDAMMERMRRRIRPDAGATRTTARTGDSMANRLKDTKRVMMRT